ncbi:MULTISPECIES: glycosyltransferase family 2 protein [Methylobacterium]|uniref:glycosyltransferase family 2 protein n=1 Tax=Methylobacterium TaxID=407 RepID=UPI002F35C46E
MDRIELSIIVPCFNEEQVIRTTNRRLFDEISKITSDFEILYVNDGSSDATYGILCSLHEEDARAKVINLSRNFGHQIAVSAGLDNAEGNAVVIIDADLQDPPHLIAAMVDLWRAGSQVVYGRRIKRSGETWFKLATAHWFYSVLNKLSDVFIPQDVGDFRLLDRRAVLALRAMPERNRFLRGMASWVGFRQTALDYHRDPRFAGETKYPLRRMVRLAGDGILSFSVVPLRVSIWIGLCAAALSMVGIFYALVLRLLTNVWVEGFTLLFVSQLFIGGVQLVFLGVVGEYIGRIFAEVKNRPLYIVAETRGIEESLQNAVFPRSRLRVLNSRPDNRSESLGLVHAGE